MIFYVSLQPPAPIEIKGNFNLPNSLWYAYKIKAAISFVVYDNIIKSFININIFYIKQKWTLLVIISLIQPLLTTSMRWLASWSRAKSNASTSASSISKCVTSRLWNKCALRTALARAISRFRRCRVQNIKSSSFEHLFSHSHSQAWLDWKHTIKGQKLIRTDVIILQSALYLKSPKK